MHEPELICVKTCAAGNDWVVMQPLVAYMGSDGLPSQRNACSLETFPLVVEH